MSVISMTGFARADGRGGGYTWSWEVKSVNGRNLDVRCRLGGGMDGLEPAVRAAAAERVRRGHVSVNLQVRSAETAGAVRINHQILDQLRAAAKDLEAAHGLAPISVDGLLGLRGVVEIVEPEETEEEREARQQAMLATLAQALDQLAEARRTEGERLGAILAEQLDEIARLIGAGEACAAAQPEALRQKLREGIAVLLEAAPGLSEERLEQEAAVLIAKADVREELDRLEAHVAAAREALAAGEAGGRRLDFLAQEFNREANTLCAKSSDIELTRIGLDLKTVIDRFREQAQNIE